MFGYGIAYAIASLSCTIGPFLAVTGASLGEASLIGRVWSYIWPTQPVLRWWSVHWPSRSHWPSSALADRMRRILPYVNRIGGAVLILVGLYVAYYGYYEVRLFNAGGNPADPVIAAAGRLQGAIAGWVHRHGPWPWMLVLAGLMVAALAWAWRAKRGSRPRRSHASRATADGDR